VITIRRAVKSTPRAVLDGALHASIITFVVTPDRDQANQPVAYVMSSIRRLPPQGSGLLHRVEVKVYDEANTDSPIWATCTCASWLYRSEVAWSLKGSSNLLHSNGKLPNTRNPSYEPWCCPHVAKVLGRILKSKAVKQAYRDALKLP